jgi:hypothetical protein
MTKHKFKIAMLCALGGCVLTLSASGLTKAQSHGNSNHHKLFLTSAVENDDFTRVTLPLYRGTSGGNPVWYVITDASTEYWAEKLGVNYAPKIGSTSSHRGSQTGTGTPESGITFEGTVDFRPDRKVDIGDYGQCAAVPILPFGPGCFAAGAVGDASYSPLVELPDGAVLNAPQIANHTGKADKATINGDWTQATFDETKGFALGRIVYYFSLDASVIPGAVLENVTYAPLLANAPKDPLGDADENASHFSAREGIIAFTNGQTGLNNPDRQGLNSTILDGQRIDLDADNNISPPVPLNIIQQVPDSHADPGFPLYSPLWDVHFTTWKSSVPVAQRKVQNDFNAVRNNPDITNPAGGPFAPSGPVANCPVISIDNHDSRNVP